MIIKSKPDDIYDETRWHPKFIFWPKRLWFEDRGTCWAMLTFVWRKKIRTKVKPLGDQPDWYETKWIYQVSSPLINPHQ